MMLLDVGWAPFLDVTNIADDGDKPTFPVLARAAMMADGGIEQSGYIDIKQPPKVKGRKLKSWKKKWVVLHEMSIRAAGRAAAKVDVYADEKTAARCPANKHTFILEYVTNIRAAKSKTHTHAFEIVENEAVLLLAGHTELESQTWISAFRGIFWPQEIENHCYNVMIVLNDHTSRLSLEGAYVMTITPEVIGIESDTQNSYEWSLPMLKRFHLNSDPEDSSKEVLVIECGPKSECGEARFLFRSDDIVHILASIKKNIFTAINMKKCANSKAPVLMSTETKPWRNSVTSSNSSNDERPRSDTLSSSEQRYRELLDPPMPDSKRTRLMSNGSELSAGSSDKTSVPSNIETAKLPSTTEESPAVPTKKRHSVTFETPRDIAKKETVDILSQPIEMSDKEEEESDYNRVLFNPPGSQATGNIITTFTIAEQGYQTKVLLDDKGYSHVSFNNNKPVIDDDKTRSLSNISSHSSFSLRSASVGSRDSGIQYQAIENTDQFQKEPLSHRSTNSFDSAVSTSSAAETNEINTIDSNPMGLKVEIHEVEVDSSGHILNNENEENGIYQDVSIDEENAGADETTKTKPVFMKSNSTGDFRKEENEYEELEKYQKGRKDIWKHLGIDPKVDPTSVPPALPERPLSQKMKRKFHNQDKKLFTLPFVKSKSKKSKEIPMSSSSSSSDSDTESVKESKNNGDLTLKKWPLGNKSIIVGNNEIYQPVAIERFLKDDEDNVVQMRERSSSLNLNMSTTFQRASKRIDKEKRAAERKTAVWKHNRNVSMNVEVLQRLNESQTMDSVLKQKCEIALQNDAENRLRSCSDSSSLGSEDEPIYAEVGPSSKPSDGAAENPFPNIALWEAHEDQSGFMDRTIYENDESMNSSKGSDVLNQCFVSPTNTGKPVTNQTEDLLIDLSDLGSDNKIISGNDVNNTTAVDIFKMEFDPFFGGPNVSETQTSSAGNNFVDIFHMGLFSQPLVPQKIVPESTESAGEVDLPISNGPDADTRGENDSDTIYMDMTACKNESIYVMPSTLKQ